MPIFVLFSIACSTRPYSSTFFDGPTSIEEEETIVATESSLEQEDTDENESDPDIPVEEDINMQQEDQELQLITEFTCVSPCSFSVENLGNVARVIYKADSWEIAESQDRNSGFAVTYDFDNGGERNIQAYAYDVLGDLLDSDKKVVDVEIEYDVEFPDVPYFYQFNNASSPGSTCANTSIAMVLSYYGWSDTPDVLTNYYGVSTAQSPAGLASVFNSEAAYFNMPQRLLPITDGSISELQSELDTGRPVIVHGYFTNAGHVLAVLGYDDNGYWVNDPAGTWNQQFKGGYPYGWEPTAGNAIYYNKYNFELAITSLDGWDYTPIWMHFVR